MENKNLYRKATKEELIEHFTEDDFVLPERWYCLYSNEAEFNVIENHFHKNWVYIDKVKEYGYTNVEGVNNWYWVDRGHSNCTEITFDQFKKYVLKQESENKDMNRNEKRFPLTLKSGDAQRIINEACEGWKDKLADKWAVSIVKGETIEVNEGFYKKMREACTTTQNELFDEIFGKDTDDKYFDLSSLKTTMFSGEQSEAVGFNNSSFMQVRRQGEYRDKGFYLDSKYNWEIKRDRRDHLVLLPTKK